MKSGFLSRNIWVIILAGLLIATGVGMGLTQMSHDRQLADQRHQIDGLSRQIDSARADTSASQATTLKLSMGVEQPRLTTDSKVIADLLSTVATWDSGEAYDTARQKIITRYGLSEKDPFLRDVMPPQGFRVDASGAPYYYIDAMGLSSSLDSTKIDLIGATADKYRYVVQVKLAVSNPKVSGSSTYSTYLIHVTVNGDGKISSLSGVAGNGTEARSN